MVSSRPRFRTWHVIVIAVTGMVIAIAIAIAIQAQVIASAGAAEPGRVEADGTVGRTRLGPDRDVAEVVWQDKNGVSHSARFRFYYPADWPEGAVFAVSYDPRDPTAGRRSRSSSFTPATLPRQSPKKRIGGCADRRLCRST